MDHRPQLCRIGDTEGQGILGMRVHYRRDIGPSLEDRGVNEPLQVKRTLIVPHRLPVEVEFDDIFGGDQFWGNRARDQKMRRIVRMSDADMTVRIHDFLLREDAVGDHEILNKGGKAAHGSNRGAPMRSHSTRGSERTRVWRQSNAKGWAVA